MNNKKCHDCKKPICTESEYESIIDDSQDISIKYHLETNTEN